MYDVWHILQMRPQEAGQLEAKQKDCEVIGYWRQSITNILFKAAASTPPGNGELIVAKWQSILHHIHNEHVNLPNPLYPLHAAMDPLLVMLNQPNTKASVKLEAIVQDKCC